MCQWSIEERMTTNTFLMIHGGVYQKGRYNRIHKEENEVIRLDIIATQE